MMLFHMATFMLYIIYDSGTYFCDQCSLGKPCDFIYDFDI